MDITNLTITELKALAYDEVLKSDTAQKNVALINTEILKKQKEEEKEEKEKTEVTPEATNG